ncbi:MAG: hypothetical protein JWR85_3372 [Marmoricola sp.]|nr:hypothetical protein [Marmoricola sp.]
MTDGGTRTRRAGRARLASVALLGVAAMTALLLPSGTAAATADRQARAGHEPSSTHAADSSLARHAAAKKHRPKKHKKHKKNKKTQQVKVPRVYGLTRADQDWYQARLKIKWTRVSGVTYQLRWADTVSRLPSARLLGTASATGVFIGPLDRGKTWQFQVRAVRSGQVGAWSTARALRFANYWPKGPTVAPGSQRTDAVTFTWPSVSYASRYRVRYSPAWYGNWPGSPTYTTPTGNGWLPQTARSTTWSIPKTPTLGDKMLAVEYANPVFAQLEASNQYVAGASQRSAWTLAWPTPPTPLAGDAVRMGSYNVMLSPVGDRAAAVAENISSHGVTLVALQEANVATAVAVADALGPKWAAVATSYGAAQQILYRTDLFTQTGGGSFLVPNPKQVSVPLVTPWAKFVPISAEPGRSQSFYVVSVHFSEDSAKTALQKNRDTGLAAQAVIREMNSVNTADQPLIVAGDIRYGREPYGDTAAYTPAQPTFIRAGFYDSMASLSRTGSAYSVVNSVGGTPSAAQTPHPSGLGPRSDHILLKGLRGSFHYVNVVNWSKNGEVPSDHNLIYADLAIPFRSS